MKRISMQYKESKVKPCLAIIHANDRQDSLSYINRKIKAIERLGFLYQYYKFDANQLNQISDKIQSLNKDSSVHGIMIQSPLYEECLSIGLFDNLVSLIADHKDVDGLKQSSPFISCTALAVMEILRYYNISPQHQQVLVIGRSKTVGEPVARLLRKHGGHVSVVHSETDKRLFNELVQQADIVVSAAGVPGVLNGEMVKRGAVLIDVGISVVDGRILGDIKHSPNPHYHFTPVPGGVGPVTVAMLMENLLSAYNSSPSNDASPFGTTALTDC